MKIIFISSSGRSGSKSLTNALSTLNNVKAFHGPRPQLDKENCLKYHGKLKNPVESIKRAREKFITNTLNSNCSYVENSWFMTALIDDFYEAYPCHVVMVIRDGRDFVRSGMSRPWFTDQKVWQNAIGRWNRDKWNPPKECKSRFSKVCWLWAEQQRVMLNSKHKPEVFKFEDLISVPLDGFISKIGLQGSATMKKANFTKKFSIPKWTDWNKKMVRQAKRWMGEMLEEFNYDW